MRNLLRRAALSAVAVLILLALIMFLPGGIGWPSPGRHRENVTIFVFFAAKKSGTPTILWKASEKITWATSEPVDTHDIDFQHSRPNQQVAKSERRNTRSRWLVMSRPRINSRQLPRVEIRNTRKTSSVWSRP
jgi:hypothetical protein